MTYIHVAFFVVVLLVLRHSLGNIEELETCSSHQEILRWPQTNHWCSFSRFFRSLYVPYFLCRVGLSYPSCRRFNEDAQSQAYYAALSP
jgi:hypothetical protein